MRLVSFVTLLVLVSATALACGNARRKAPPDASAASVVAPAVASERAALASPSPAGPEVPEHQVTDPAFDAFEERLLAACQPKDMGTTTQEMAESMHATGRCLHRRLAALAKALPKATLRGLTVGAPRELDGDVFSRSWAHLVDAACGLDDAVSYVGNGVSRLGGTMRYVESPSCFVGSLTEGVYLLESLGRPDGAKAFADRVRATATEGGKRLVALPEVRESLSRLRGIAHDDALFDDECFFCSLSDADWRRLMLDVDTLLDESATLAHALCGVWPALAGELGGADRCEGPVHAYFVWYLLHVPAPFATGVGRETYAGYPPPKDPAYRAYVDPLTDSCRQGESLHYSSDAFEQRVLRCLRRAAPPAPQRRELRRALDRYVERLCAVEAAVTGTSLRGLTQVHSRFGNRVGNIQCPLLSAQRIAYVLSSRTTNSVAGFAGHVRARVPWAAQIREGASRVRRIATTAACNDYSAIFDGACRSPELKEQEWRRLDRELADLPAAALLPARTLCNDWPELALELGAAQCEQTLTEYFLSYGMFVGLAARPNK